MVNSQLPTSPLCPAIRICPKYYKHRGVIAYHHFGIRPQISWFKLHRSISKSYSATRWSAGPGRPASPCSWRGRARPPRAGGGWWQGTPHVDAARLGACPSLARAGELVL